MAYTILNTDGTTLLLLADGTFDKVATSITLVGKNVNSYGEVLNNNLVKMLGNFATDGGNPPRSPLTGQLWYDTTAKRLKIYDNGFKNISGATVTSERPTTLAIGDLWFDSENQQLKVINGSQDVTIGPLFPKSVGENGWVLPTSVIKDNNLNVKNVTFLRNYGNLIGVITSEEFTMYQNDATNFFGTSTVSLVSGVNIFGNINYTGMLRQYYLSLNVDIDVLTPFDNDITNSANFVTQTLAINNLLNAVYPINTTTNKILNPLNPLSIETGVPAGSEARVVCEHTVPSIGYQVRRFIAKSNPPTWDYYEISTATIVDLNVIATIIP